jgi:hypothetical protein
MRQPGIVRLTPLLFAVVIAGGCGTKPPQIPVTAVDFEIIEAILTDIIEYDDETRKPRPQQAPIILGDEAVSAIDFGALNNAWRRGKRIPPALIADVKRRNPKGARQSIKPYQPINPKIMVIDAKPLLQGEEFGYPPGFAPTYVISSLPGYSEDGQNAVLAFRFGPSAHGAFGYCLLQKVDGVWKILDRQMLFFT